MARFKRKLIQLGNKSLVVTIPWELVEALDLKKGERVYVSLNDSKRIVIVEKSDSED
ncbi:MAG: AbrB/MazE/SpoVT family DNA-binding domain-containing protein [Candidatus Thermoplasmatota archaeon]